MRGLIQKDICLVLGRNRSLAIFLLVGAIMGISTNSSFVISYMTILACIISIGTISYDEFDNGYPFIFTLPITRKDYVKSKYVFGIIMGLIGMICGTIITFIVKIISKEIIDIDLLEQMLASINLILLSLSLMLPLQLKYGAEKSRIVIALVAAICMGIGYLSKTLLANLSFDITQINIPDKQVIIILTAISLIAIIFSYLISTKIVKNKEF